MSVSLVVAVLLAGALGALARHRVSLAFIRPARISRAVLVVNVLGSIIAGAVLALGEWGIFDHQLQLVLSTGIAGGLTTFSTLSVDTMKLALSGRWRTAVANLVVNLMLGLGGATAAFFVACGFLELNRYSP